MNRNKDPHRYDALLTMPHYVNPNRKHMSMHDRAAQFSPFKALSGYEDHITETSRLAVEQREPGEEDLFILNQRLQKIRINLDKKPFITIRYFIKDERKEGGHYASVSFHVRKIDPVRRILQADDKSEYSLDLIDAIEGDLFTEDDQ